MRTTSIAADLAAGQGVLVLDDYAVGAIKAAGAGAPEPARYIEMVVGSSDLSPFLSSVVVGPEAMPAGGTPPSGVGLGVQMSTHAAADETSRRLSALVEQRVGLVEWRANLSPGQVARGATHTDAEALAAGAAASISAGIAPLLTVAMPDLESQTPEVTHAATANALTALSGSLARAAVDPSDVLLRVNMILPGSAHGSHPTPEATARSTLRVLGESIAPDLGGIVLLSGGQHLDRACANLAAITTLARLRSAPWPISFGFTRALVDASLDVPDPGGEEAVVAGLVRACRLAAQSASGAEVEPLAAG